MALSLLNAFSRILDSGLGVNKDFESSSKPDLAGYFNVASHFFKYFFANGEAQSCPYPISRFVLIKGVEVDEQPL